MDTELSERARDLINSKMKELGLSAHGVAMAESLDDSSMYRYLTGKTNRVSFEIAARAMRYLGITMVEVFGEYQPKASGLPKGL